ncbi:MAG: SIMPL domain-containing protein [Gaiellaceae bacterium]
MKRSTFALVVIMLLVLGLASACGSSTRPTRRTISVSADATIKAKPDLANFSFGVSTDGASSSQALTANSIVMRRVIIAIKKQGVAARDIQTQNVNVYPKTDSNGNTTGYSASNTVSVDLHEVLKSGRLITRVTAAGANLESGPTFSLEKIDLTYERALNEALDKAQAKADSMAGHVGLNLGKPASIKEGAPVSAEPVYGSFDRLATASKPLAVPVKRGRIEVSASVTVVYSAS